MGHGDEHIWKMRAVVLRQKYVVNFFFLSEEKWGEFHESKNGFSTVGNKCKKSIWHLWLGWIIYPKLQRGKQYVKVSALCLEHSTRPVNTGFIWNEYINDWLSRNPLKMENLSGSTGHFDYVLPKKQPHWFFPQWNRPSAEYVFGTIRDYVGF